MATLGISKELTIDTFDISKELIVTLKYYFEK